MLGMWLKGRKVMSPWGQGVDLYRRPYHTKFGMVACLGEMYNCTFLEDHLCPASTYKFLGTPCTYAHIV